MLLQSVRGTFGSGGEFEPMRHEITDGQDTVGRLPVADGFRDLLGRELTGAERWLEHPGPADPFWAPMQCAPAVMSAASHSAWKSSR